MLSPKVKTFETRIIPNKKASEEANLLNGASNGRELENNCIRFAQLSLYERELVANIKAWLYA